LFVTDKLGSLTAYLLNYCCQNNQSPTWQCSGRIVQIELCSFCAVDQVLKDHRQRIPKIVLRRHLERSIQKNFFSNLHSLQIDYFSRKKLKLRKFTVAVYVIYIYGRDVTHWCQL